MKTQYKVALIGVGTREDPRRPDLPDLPKNSGWIQVRQIDESTILVEVDSDDPEFHKSVEVREV